MFAVDQVSICGVLSIVGKCRVIGLNAIIAQNLNPLKKKTMKDITPEQLKKMLKETACLCPLNKQRTS